LYYSKDIESFGTGLRRIAETCNIAGVRFEFRKLKSGFVVCFYRSNEKADIAFLSEEQVLMFKSDFRIVADYFVQMRKNNTLNAISSVIEN
jgi:hypothetical protein